MANNTCVQCSEIIPEGRMVCPKCETKRADTNLVEIAYMLGYEKGFEDGKKINQERRKK